MRREIVRNATSTIKKKEVNYDEIFLEDRDLLERKNGFLVICTIP